MTHKIVTALHYGGQLDSDSSSKRRIPYCTEYHSYE